MNDKRTVFTDALETLGTIIDEHAKRDAIHLAVEPVIAGQYLDRADIIGLGEDGLAYRELSLCKDEKLLGIVDPFVDEVLEGQKFWMVIFPRKITSLRHVWEHPDIPNVLHLKNRSTHAKSNNSVGVYMDDIITSKDRQEQIQRQIIDNYIAGSINIENLKKDSMEWLENYASNLGCYNANDLITAARIFIETGEYFFGNHDYDFDGESLHPEFWHHFEIVTKIKVPEHKRKNFFSCAC